jgi:hypothetical protein
MIGGRIETFVNRKTPLQGLKRWGFSVFGAELLVIPDWSKGSDFLS